MYNPLSTRPPATTTCTMHRTCMIHTMHTIFMPCCLTQTHHSPKPSPGGLVFVFQPNHLPSEAWYGQQPYNGSILPGNACYNKRSNIFNYLAAQQGQQPYNGSILPGNACYNKRSNIFNYLAAQYGQQPYNGSILPGNACYNKKSNVFDSSVEQV